MASRKEQKEQARAARLAQEQDAAAKAQRNRRYQMFGGATVIAVVVIVVAIVASSSGGGGPKGAHNGPLKAGTKAERQLVSSVDTLLNGIHQSGNTLGSPTAKVTMQYFGDLECPFCQAFTLNVFPSFVQQEVRTGKVKVEYRSMCTATCGSRYSQAQTQAFFNAQQLAAYAAGKQSKFWQYAELFYHQQKEEDTGYATNSYLTAIAQQIPGLNVQTWQTDRKDPALADQLAADQAYASKANLPGTPSLIMTGPKGTELVNNGNLVSSESQLTTAVKAVT